MAASSTRFPTRPKTAAPIRSPRRSTPSPTATSSPRPTARLITSALEARATHLSIAHAARFLSLAPRDHFANFSAVLYENLGPALAPLASLLSTPEQARSWSGLKPALVAAYAAPDEITVAGSSELLGGNLKDLLSGSIAGIAGHALPLGQLFGLQMGGTRQRERAYK